MKKAMPMWQWLASTAIAAVMMAVAVLGCFWSYVYARSEGLALEARTDKLERSVDEVEKTQREDLVHMRDKIDEIYRLLLERRK